MKLGAHCVLYGAEIASDTEAVIKRLADSGAEGCELGERFFGVKDREKLTSLLDKYHVALAGMHANNVKLLDLLHDPATARAAMEKVAGFVSVLPDKNIIVSGGVPDMEQLKNCTLAEGVPHKDLHDPDNVRTLAENFNTIAGDIYKEYGVRVNYHNHSWEFADDGLIWFALADYAPEVHFALDTGWAAVSGFDPVELLKRYPGRFHYVHLRDFKKSDNPLALNFNEVHAGYVDLGTGDMDYPRLMRQLNRNLDDKDWAIVEYELGNFDQSSYQKALSYLHGIRDMLQTEGR